MVFIVIPVRRRVVIYYCPHCPLRQRFFSLLPVLTPEWRCKRCHKTFKINAVCIGSNWAGVFALWSMPPVLLACEILMLIVALLGLGRHPQVSMREYLGQIIVGLLCVGPIVMLTGAMVFFIVGFFVGLVYGVVVTNRR